MNTNIYIHLQATKYNGKDSLTSCCIHNIKQNRTVKNRIDKYDNESLMAELKWAKNKAIHKKNKRNKYTKTPTKY